MRLKDRTLKNVYERRERRGMPLLEAQDMQKLNAATNAVAKLKGIVPDEAALFNGALEAAKTDLQKYMAGGVKQAFKNIATDPVAKATSMASAIRAGFAALPKVIQMYLPPGSEKETQKSCYELVPDDKQQMFLQTMTKAFAPATTGAMSSLKSLFSSGGMPYIQNLNAAVQELLQNVNVNLVFKAGQQAAAAPAVEPAAAASPDAAAPATADATAPATVGQAAPTPTQAPASATGTQPTQAPAAATAAKGTAPATATAAATTAPTSATPKKIAVADTAAIADLANYLTKKVGLDAATLTKVLTQLAKEQKLVS